MSAPESITLKLERQLLPPSSKAQAASLLIPAIAVATVFTCIWIFGSKEKLLELVTLMVVSFFGGGKFIVFVPCIPLEHLPETFKNLNITYGIWELSLMVTCMDTITAFLVTYNLHLLNKIPKVGPMLKNTRKDCYFLLQASPWMRKMAFVVVVLFVAFPVSGTGAIAGAFLGTLLGLSRRITVITIVVGAFLGSFGMGLGAWAVGEDAKVFIEKPYVSWTMLIVLVALIVWASMKMKRMIREQKEKELVQQNIPTSAN